MTTKPIILFSLVIIQALSKRTSKHVLNVNKKVFLTTLLNLYLGTQEYEGKTSLLLWRNLDTVHVRWFTAYYLQF